jgi:hypothetical protein
MERALEGGAEIDEWISTELDFLAVIDGKPTVL